MTEYIYIYIFFIVTHTFHSYPHNLSMIYKQSICISCINTVHNIHITHVYMICGLFMFILNTTFPCLISFQFSAAILAQVHPETTLGLEVGSGLMGP